MNIDWNRRAGMIAEVEFKANFATRWGVEELVGENTAYLFCNSPPRRKVTARDKQFSAIRRELAQIGITEMGHGEYPDRGPDEGYSCVSIFQTSPDQVTTIRNICQSVFSSNCGWEDES